MILWVNKNKMELEQLRKIIKVLREAEQNDVVLS
jgi:hypothetical protein